MRTGRGMLPPKNPTPPPGQPYQSARQPFDKRAWQAAFKDFAGERTAALAQLAREGTDIDAVMGIILLNGRERAIRFQDMIEERNRADKIERRFREIEAGWKVENWNELYEAIDGVEEDGQDLS